MATPTPAAAPAPKVSSATSNIRFVWCPSVANLNAPTTAEITAGTDFTNWIDKAGISGFDTSAATVTADFLDSGVDIPVADGRSVSGTPTVVFKRSPGVTGSPQSVFTYGVSGVAVLLDAPSFSTSGATMSLWSCTVGSATPTWSGLKTLTVAFTPNAVPAENIAVPTV